MRSCVSKIWRTLWGFSIRSSVWRSGLAVEEEEAGEEEGGVVTLLVGLLAHPGGEAVDPPVVELALLPEVGVDGGELHRQRALEVPEGDVGALHCSLRTYCSGTNAGIVPAFRPGCRHGGGNGVGRWGCSGPSNCRSGFSS
jgi:hypothetical protein